MRILFVTATRLGDAVLSTALLDHLLRRFPEARFTIACGPVAAGVFARMPRLDEVIVVEKRRFDLHWLALWARVARQRWSLVVDLRGSALGVLVPARRRVIMRGGRRPGHRLTHIAGSMGIVERIVPVAWTAPADAALAERVLPAPGPLIGLGPTANWAGKIWPSERFAALATALCRLLPGARIAIFGGPGGQERTAAAPLLAALPGAIDLVGKLSLPEAAACLARCTLFVGNDSGLMHLAAAAGAATIGLFGPTPASEYAPAGRMTAVALADGPDGQGSMDALPVEAVLRVAHALLQADRQIDGPVRA